MAEYKVIQDIEAEDKLLGPLSLRQFIYAIIVVISLFAAYKLSLVKWFLPLPLLPIIVFFGLLAAPLGGVQSSEIWLLAKIRFFFKPRRRVWNQDGIQELVTITVPKVIEKVLTKDFAPGEAESRLQALANTIDSRGWVVKNVDVSLYAQPAFGQTADTERLMQISTAPMEVPAYDSTPNDDILDDQNNPRIQNLDRMIQQSAQDRRKQLLDQMQQPVAPEPETQTTATTTQDTANSNPADYWFIDPATASNNQASGYTAGSNMSGQYQPPTPQSTNASQQNSPTIDEQALLDKIHFEQNKPQGNENLPTLQPMATQPISTTLKTAETVVTAVPDPAIIELANNDDLDVATIQRQGHKPKANSSTDGEVVISLH